MNDWKMKLLQLKSPLERRADGPRLFSVLLFSDFMGAELEPELILPESHLENIDVTINGEVERLIYPNDTYYFEFVCSEEAIDKKFGLYHWFVFSDATRCCEGPGLPDRHPDQDIFDSFTDLAAALRSFLSATPVGSALGISPLSYIEEWFFLLHDMALQQLHPNLLAAYRTVTWTPSESACERQALAIHLLPDIHTASRYAVEWMLAASEDQLERFERQLVQFVKARKKFIVERREGNLVWGRTVISEPGNISDKFDTAAVEKVKSALESIGWDAKAESVYTECKPMRRATCLSIRRELLSQHSGNHGT